MSFGFSDIQSRTRDWQAVFFLGVAAVVVTLYNAPWHWPFASKPVPFTPAVVPPAPPVLQAQPRAAPATQAVAPKIIQSLPPATFTPQVAPASIPELEGIERPAPGKKPPTPEFGVQHGYSEPNGPEPENVR